MSTNPYEPTEFVEQNDRLIRPRPNRWIEALVVIGIIGLLVFLFSPAIRTARPSAKRTQCANNAKHIALAMHSYLDEYQSLPPAYTVDADGKPLHSWRTLILPYLEHQELYESIDLSKPWDHPANADAYDSMPWVYRCPSTEPLPNYTTYVVVISDEGLFHGAEMRSEEDVEDGFSNTLLMVEVPEKHAVHWMAPHDIDEKWWMNFDGSSELPHNDSTTIAMGDGTVRQLPSSTPPDARRALLTHAGYDQPEESSH